VDVCLSHDLSDVGKPGGLMASEERMSVHGSSLETHAVGSTRLFFMVWVWLVVITCIEVFLAYERLRPDLMLTLLIVLSLVKATLIISYFMHLKYEKIGLALLIIPSTIFCICMIIIFFMPDGLRLMQMRTGQ
jgi:cytochrome c oxidase subunit 4